MRQTTSRSPGKASEEISARLVSSKRLSCRSPSLTSFFTCGAFSAVIHDAPSVSPSASRLALVAIPRSQTRTASASPKRRLSFSIWAGSVAASRVEPAKASIAIGRPAGSQSSP